MTTRDIKEPSHQQSQLKDVREEALSAIWFKVTNAEEKHDGVKYDDGLIVLNGPFDLVGTCVKGRLYITKRQYIPNFYQEGINLRIMELPETDPKFKKLRDMKGDRWGVNMVIAKRKFSLFDPLTYDLFGLKMEENKWILHHACITQNIKFLEDYYSGKFGKLEYQPNTQEQVVIKGCTDVINFWSKKYIDIKLSEAAIKSIITNSDTKMVECLYQNGVYIKIPQNLIDERFLKEDIEMLHCLGQNNLLTYDKSKIIMTLTKNKCIKVMEWMFVHEFEVVIPEDALTYASENELIDILDCFKNSGWALVYYHEPINSAIRDGKIRSLDWWLKSGLPFEYSRYCFRYYYDKTRNCQYYSKDDPSIMWLKENGLPLPTDKPIF